jgi:hypothetical protein
MTCHPLTVRIVDGMASYRVLPAFLSNVSRRFATPRGLLTVGPRSVFFKAPRESYRRQ